MSSDNRSLSVRSRIDIAACDKIDRRGTPRLALIFSEDPFVARRVVEFLVFGLDEDVVVGQFTKIDAWRIDTQAFFGRFWRDVLDVKFG